MLLRDRLRLYPGGLGQLAKDAGIHRSSLYRVAMGRTTFPSVHIFQAVLALLDKIRATLPPELALLDSVDTISKLWIEQHRKGWPTQSKHREVAAQEKRKRQWWLDALAKERASGNSQKPAE